MTTTDHAKHSSITRRVLTHGDRGERGARGVFVSVGEGEGVDGVGDTGRREEGGGGCGKSPALSMFIMIRDAAMLWHHVLLGTVTSHPAAIPPPPPTRSPQNAFRAAAVANSTS